MADWYYVIGGERKGPVTEPALARLLEAGTIPRDIFIWQQGMAEWKSAHEVPAFSRRPAPPAKKAETIKPAKTSSPPGKPAQKLSLKIPYRMGVRHIFLWFLYAAFGAFLLYLAATNRRGLLIDFIFRLDPHQASIFYAASCGVFLLALLFLGLSILRSLLLPGSIVFSDKQVLIPRRIFPGSRAFPYSSIQSIVERRTRRMRRISAVMYTKHGRVTIDPSMLPSREVYEAITRLLTSPVSFSKSSLGRPSFPAVLNPYSSENRRVRWISLGSICGLAALAVAAFYGYQCYKGADSSRVMSIEDFDKSPSPKDGNYLLTGAYADLAHPLVYHEFAGTPADLPTYFVPLQETPFGAATGHPAKVFVWYTQPHKKSSEAGLASDRIPVYVTQMWDSGRIIRGKLREMYGPSIDSMVFVAYGQISLIYLAAAFLILGLFLVARAWLMG